VKYRHRDEGIIMNLLKRSWNSLVDQGPTRTCQTVLSVFGDYWFDWRYGLSTVQEVLLTDLDVPRREEGAVDYQASRTRYFHRLLKRVNAPRGSVFVDLGAGKGRTLLIAAQHGYRRAVGVEFSGELCEAARRNIDTFRRKEAVSAELRVVHADVSEYAISDDENVIYVSAFACETMQRVLRNLTQSLARAPREMKLIYHNPYCPQAIAEHGGFLEIDKFVYGSNTALIYVSRKRSMRCSCG
jgi:SAM-dependent methyltransferase